jgi:hypothetical protein
MLRKDCGLLPNYAFGSCFAWPHLGNALALRLDPTLSLWIESENLIMVRQYGKMKSSFGVADSTTF